MFGQARLRKLVAGFLASVAVVVTGCASTGSRPGATLVGYTWRITEVRHDGDSTSIPAALDGYVAFAPDGTLGASDGVNGYFGRYAVEGTGYRPNNAGFTLVGYSGHDPSQLALIAAVQALTRSDVVSATEDGTDRIQLTVHGYTVTCARHGAARNEPTPSPTSTHS